MIRCIFDYCTCDECLEEYPEGYRVLDNTLCGECLEALFIELEDKYA